MSRRLDPWQGDVRAWIDAACEKSDVPDDARERLAAACRDLGPNMPAPMFEADHAAVHAVWTLGRYRLEIAVNVGVIRGEVMDMCLLQRDGRELADMRLAEGLWVFAIVLARAQLAQVIAWEVEECERIADAEERGEVEPPPLHRARQREISGDGA